MEGDGAVERGERSRDLHLRIQEVTTALSRALTEPEIARAVVDVGTTALGLRNGAVFQLDGDSIVMTGSLGYLPQVQDVFARVPVSASNPLATAVREKRAVFVSSRSEYAERFPEDESRGRQRDDRPLAFACLPLLVESRAVGAIAFTWPSEHAFDDDERRFLVLLASNCAQAFERARLYAELRDTGSTLEAIVRASPMAIAVMDLDGTVRLWNAAAEKIFGYTSAEVLGKVHPTIDDANRRFFLDNLARIGRGEVFEGVEVRRRHADGRELRLAMWAGPIRHGHEVQCLAVVGDVSARVRVDEGVRLLAHAGTVLATTSFDEEETLRRVAALVVPDHADWCFVDLVEEGSAFRRVAIAHADPAKDAIAEALKRRYPLRPDLPLGVSAVARLAKPTILRDVDEAKLRSIARDEAHFEAIRRMDVRSFASAPLLARGEVLGVLSIGSTTRNLDETDLWVTQELARAAGAALDNARLFRSEQAARAAAEAERDRLARLQRATAALTAARTREDVARIFLDEASAALDECAGVVHEVDDARIGAVLGARGTLASPIDDALAEAIREERAVFHTDGNVHHVVVPLFAAARVVGVAALECRGRDPFEPANRALLLAIAAPCGQALDRTRLRDLLEASERKYRHIVESAHEGVWLADAERRTTFVNPRVTELLGMRAEELLGRDSLELVVEGTLEEARRQIERRRAGKADQYELAMRRKDGAIIWLRVSASPIFDDDNQYAGTIALLADITARKRDEADRAFLSEATEILGASIDVEATLAKLVRLAVPTLADWCSIEIVDARGLPRWHEVAHVDPAKVDLARELRARYPRDLEHDAAFLARLRAGEPILVPTISAEQIRATARDEEHARILLSLGFGAAIIIPLRVRDETLGVLNLVQAESGRRYDARDLALATELGRRAAAALDNARFYAAERDARAHAEEALRIRDNFLSVASHELRTPITGLALQIQSLLRASKRGVVDDRVLPKLKSANEQIARLSALVDNLLDVSRLSVGRMTIEPEEVDLAAMVREVVARFDDELRESSRACTITAEEPLVVVADRLRLDQVITNLLTNAIKYGRQGPITIAIRADGEAFAALSVRDEGIGIAPEAQSRIFERFERAVDSRAISGFGLGLWIVRSVLELMHGSIAVESEPGRGSTFTARLPRANRA